jgi:hypothetical protein
MIHDDAEVPALLWVRGVDDPLSHGPFDHRRVFDPLIRSLEVSSAVGHGPCALRDIPLCLLAVQEIG